MEKKEYLELGRILIDFPLPYRSIKELSIREEGNEHSSLNLKLVADRRFGREDVLRYEKTPIRIYTPEGNCLCRNLYEYWAVLSESVYGASY